MPTADGMTATTPTPLSTLPYQPYLTADGCIPSHLERQIGIYAIFDHPQTLRYIGYSRDIYQSLKQHLVRQPEACCWYKVQTIERPNRTLLETLRQAWIHEHPDFSLSPEDEAAWSGAIDARQTMTAAEWTAYEALPSEQQPQYLKTIARRLEAQILETLADRGVTMEIRFNPKRKVDGLLDLK